MKEFNLSNEIIENDDVSDWIEIAYVKEFIRILKGKSTILGKEKEKFIVISIAEFNKLAGDKLK